MNNTEKRPKLDMLNGSIWNKIPQYALPGCRNRNIRTII